MRRLPATDGAALLIALMAMLLMTALATTLVLTTITETRIASSYGAGIEAFYAADAAIERVIDDLRTVPDWRTLGTNGARSTFVDGPSGGARTLPDGTTIDLEEETRIVREDSPQWRLFAYGALGNLLAPGQLTSRTYLVAWVAPSPDSPSPSGQEALRILARAYGPQGARRSLRVVIERKPINGPTGIFLISWREGP